MDTSTSVDTGFADLGLRPEILKALAGLGYEEPTPIQREAIPHMINGKDLLGQAATGTGKTAAFALPILQLLEMNNDRPSPVALVLVPTANLRCKCQRPSISTDMIFVPVAFRFTVVNPSDVRLML